MSGVPIADAAQPGMSSASTLDAPGELTRASGGAAPPGAFDAGTQPPPGEAEQPMRGARLALLTFALSLATFIEVLDSTVTNVAVPSISGSLGVSNSQGTWVISSYSVAAAIAVPLTGGSRAASASGACSSPRSCCSR